MLLVVSSPFSISSLPSLPSVDNPITPLDIGLPASVITNDGGQFCHLCFTVVPYFFSNILRGVTLDTVSNCRAKVL